WLEPGGGVWRQAATQVFFSLGLGFGSVIAYSSYNPRHNDCHADGLLVATINFLTSLLATLVVFAVLGFRATAIARACVLTQLLGTGTLPILELPTLDPAALSPPQYSAWYHRLHAELGTTLQGHGVTDCRLEDEMNKGVEGTGLAFITFTEAMTLFPASPFWSVLFFLMLLTLGLSTMLGNMQGILTPLLDRYPLLAVLCRRVPAGLMFVQRSGVYFCTPMFDDYSATLPLVPSWPEAVFGQKVETMLGWPALADWAGGPEALWLHWRYGSLLAMLGLLLAKPWGQICRKPPPTRPGTKVR
uniref:Uncharacterized protein n=1 Tax=Chelonoidis abingdonii TaxID=106734 RepID=A0A8C0G2X1_CHEAB